MEKNSFKKNKLIFISCIALIFVLIAIYLLWGNQSLQVSFYEVTDDKIPEAFNDFRIAQISDLHNASFGRDNSRLIAILERNQPDIICITGDLIDSNHTNMDVAMTFIEQAVEIAPCYYVMGNHEAWIGNSYKELEDKMLDCGVVVLHNQAVELKKSDETIILAGINDPDSHQSGIIRTDIDKALGGYINGDGREDAGKNGIEEHFTILLSHRPEAFEEYVKKNIHLILSGHAHGGQFRLPIIGGVVAPNQGLFPKYDSGIYQNGESTMVVSRGLGNSVIPVRINNRPEVVFVVLSN